MKKQLSESLRTSACLVLACLGVTAFNLPCPAAAKDSRTLCVMTFNLRYASTNPPNAWSDRRPVTRSCIEKVSPDLIGTQEGLYQQLKDMAADLPQYGWIGLGREGGSHGEFMAVFYRLSRFDPLEYDHFWLSDTPDVIGSSTWGNSNRRMVTWVRFLDRQTQQQFYFFNTHLDHEVQLAREKGAALIRQRVEALQTPLPVLLVGDFNAAAGANKAYSLLVDDKGFTDTWHSAAERRGEIVGTFHNYKTPIKDGPRIDWILTRGPLVAEATEIITFSLNGQRPSDHFPVAAWVRFDVTKK